MSGVAIARSDRVDRLRGLALCLVLFGHALEPWWQDPTIGQIYRALYVFHVPLLAFLSGRCAPDRDGVLRIIDSLLVPYVVLEFFYLLFCTWWNGFVPRYPPFFAPQWTNWYLVSLASWRLLWKRFGHLTLLPWLAWGLALVAPCFFSSWLVELSLGRTISFFPWFLAGAYSRTWLGDRPFSRVTRTAAMMLSVLMALALLRYYRASFYSLYGAASYEFAGLTPARGMGLRIVAWAAAAALIAGLWIGLPRSRVLSRIGRHSLYPFVLHPYFVIPLRDYLYLKHWSLGVSVFYLAAGSLGIAYFSVMPMARRLVNGVVASALRLTRVLRRPEVETE